LKFHGSSVSSALLLCPFAMRSMTAVMLYRLRFVRHRAEAYAAIATD